MSQTVIGLFDEFSQAHAAVTELEGIGVPQGSISVVANNANDEYTSWRDIEGKNLQRLLEPALIPERLRAE